MKILCVLGRHNYGNPSRGEGYEYVNFMPALHNLGHDVAFFESFDRLAYADFADLNRQFLQTVQREKPDVILTVLLGYEIWQETLELIRACTPAILINWSTDDSWKYTQFSKWIARPFHVYATTSAKALAEAQRDGHDNFVLTQWAAAADKLRRPLAASQCRYEVSFIGTAYGNRRRWINGLAKRGIAVSCFGYGWQNAAVKAADIPEIIRQSVISLNFGDSGVHFKYGLPYRSRQIKARVFETAGAGGCLLTETAEYLGSYFIDGAEIVTFWQMDDLAANIRYYLEQPQERDRLAKAGNDRVRAEHTYEKRFDNLLERVNVEEARKQHPEYSLDFVQFEKIAAQHPAGWALKLFRHLLTFPCVLVWGKQRGPRAARRILFELSWRMAGGKTYSATGWPGRLFYRES